MEVQWLTYDEMAERLGMGRESARTLVKRKRWARQNGNDGKVRIGVPIEEIEARAASQERPSEASADPSSELSQERPQERPSESSQELGVAAVLTRHVERLEAQLEEALEKASDRDEIRNQRDLATAQVEALRAALAAAERDRDRWHEVATTRAPEPAPRRAWWPFRRAS